MVNLTRRFNYGQKLREDNPQLYNQLNDTYEDTANVVNTKIGKNVATSNPANSADINKNFDILDLWVNTSSNTVWAMTSRTTPTNVVWTQIT